MKRRRALVAPERLATLGDELAELLRVPVQVERVAIPQPAIQEEAPIMAPVEAPMPDLTPDQAMRLAEQLRRMAAPWPSSDCDYWALDTSELTKAERWELMPMPPPISRAVPAAMPGGG